MKKRFAAIASVISIILGASIGFAACDKESGDKANTDNPAHTHQYTEKVIAATCAKKGYTLHTCSCGDKYEDNYTVSNVHTYENNVCKVCNKISSSMPDTQGMQFFEYYNTDTYYLSSIPTYLVKDEYIKIPSTYNGKPVTRIGENALNGNSKIKSIYIPDSVTALDGRSIYDCSSLTSVTIGSGVNFISDTSLYHCPQLVNIEVSPDNAKYSSKSNCLINKEDNEIILGTENSVIPEGVDGIGMEAFSGLTKLTRVDIGDSIKYVKYLAFSGCTNLTTVNFGKNVYQFNNMSFMNCDKLTDISVSPENKDYYSVNNCIIEKETKTLVFGVKSCVIPEDGSVEIIRRTAFEYCSMESIAIPVSVKEIQGAIISGAFYGCKNLRDINYKGTKAEWEKIVKGNGWDYGTADYTVHCSDGDIDKK